MSEAISLETREFLKAIRDNFDTEDAKLSKSMNENYDQWAAEQKQIDDNIEARAAAKAAEERKIEDLAANRTSMVFHTEAMREMLKSVDAQIDRSNDTEKIFGNMNEYVEKQKRTKKYEGLLIESQDKLEAAKERLSAAEERSDPEEAAAAAKEIKVHTESVTFYKRQIDGE